MSNREHYHENLIAVAYLTGFLVLSIIFKSFIVAITCSLLIAVVIRKQYDYNKRFKEACNAYARN